MNSQLRLIHHISLIQGPFRTDTATTGELHEDHAYIRVITQCTPVPLH